MPVVESESTVVESVETTADPENDLAELYQTAALPEIKPLDVAEDVLPAHKSISFVSDEELQKPQVEAFRKMYLSEKWSALLRYYLESAMEYRLYVRKAVQDKELPEMLEYLPVVESNYKTNAKSRSGAIGMWQFMANSVWPFLTLNDFVDERLDPWKSTDAALRKLTDNYNIFNDWLLAIGAYNCGVGAMNKAIKKAGGKKDFWYLAENGYLSRQTAEYVPKLIAIADLAINNEYYGIDIPSHDEEFGILENEKNGNFDYITVKKAFSLNLLAQEMRMDSDTLKKLNPSFTLGMTHPSRESQIRLPLGMAQSALDALENIKPVDFPIKYTVVAGDSLWSISRKYKTTVSAICELNGIKENAILKIGKILYIPSK
ncbi:MAG: transglycosylase SLT domain-containing protein [Treponema sp.]|nr:transglycosylase SLT domain-containing protein [Treponema sp.]